MDQVSFSVRLTGTVDLNGAEKEEIERQLRQGMARAIGDGLITGFTEAEVDGYSLDISVTEEQGAEAG